ncbi:MAG: histidine--tRNA ligase [Candidatus Sumerlaea chitinivorans]|nr:histidine--tRNA ligase [Candidatus Sumerlaea chitinivorans]
MGETEQVQRTIQAIRGTKDVLPAESRAYQWVEETARKLFEAYGYREIRTPILEPTELFVRSVGEASDIVVSKQMYTFTDPGERSNTLRPEGTAGVARALIESGLLKETSQQKLYYIGPMFRYEKPQKGRLRQFTQIGIEFFGVAHPAADAEIITICDRFLRKLGFPQVTTRLNNIGCKECRRAYNERLREEIAKLGASAGEGEPQWCEQCLRRAELNPMRVFDCKLEDCQKLAAKLPKIADAVCDTCTRHAERLAGLLDSVGIHYELAPELVRGLDYYTRTVFEIVHGGLGAQNAVIGGGRYDDLIEELGGPPTPAVGMSIGVERLLLALEANEIEPPPPPEVEFYILALDEEALDVAFRLAEHARTNNVPVIFDCQPRSARAGLKAANKAGARVALIIGADEVQRQVVQWKNLESSEQVELELAEVERNLTEM